GRVQHYLDAPSPNFAREIGKISYALVLVIRLAALGLAAYVCGAIALGGYALATGRYVSLLSVLAAAISHRWYGVILAAIALLLMRKTIVKLQEYDSDR